MTTQTNIKTNLDRKMATAEHQALTDMQSAFVQHLVNGACTATEAARRAGYSGDGVRQVASQLMRKPHVLAAIRSEQQRRLYGLGSKALSVIEGILDDDDAPAGVRLDAAKTVLDRCGLTVATAREEQTRNEKPLEELTAAELEAFIIDCKRQLQDQQTVTVEGQAQVIE